MQLHAVSLQAKVPRHQLDVCPRSHGAGMEQQCFGSVLSAVL